MLYPRYAAEMALPTRRDSSCPGVRLSSLIHVNAEFDY